MEKTELISRYPSVHSSIAMFIGDKKTLGVFISDTHMMHVHTTPDQSEIKAIDSDGGPMIKIDDIIGDRKLVTIRPAYIMEFENDLSSQ